MATPPVDFTSRKLLRLWPGVIAAAFIMVAALVVPRFSSDLVPIGMMGAIAGALVILIWWLFFSRAPWLERVSAIALMALALYLTSRVVHRSISNGMMGMMLPVFAIPALCFALAVGAAVGQRLSTGMRRVSMTVAILLAAAAFTLIRTGGVSGEGNPDLHWRWEKTPEERLLAETIDEPTARTAASTEATTKPSATPATTNPSTTTADPAAAKTSEKPGLPATEPRAIWPGFRGPNRDGVVRGVRIETDWSKSPPVELWRRKIGPGWSSFAVRGDLCYTQEQRGNDELVSCYHVSSGKTAWRHSDAARFWESNAGAGPRATPTVTNGRVYTFGATGILNALDANNGTVVWSRNAASDTSVKTPGWGFASSPLVVNDLVVVAASGRLAAYEIATGNQKWMGPARGGSYSSPQLMTIGGVAQILLLSGNGAMGVAPSDGAVLWEHAWSGTAMLQPARTPDGDLLITTGDMSGGSGTRRISVARGSSGWTVDERWTSTGLKPYYNDFVVHNGHAYGFDGSILACIDLQDGKRKWKGGRYGHGQLVLLPDQDLLLVLSEEGELALVAATPDQFTELARVPALEGKTWNHPVLAGDVLLVRNGEEMAAFKLSLAGR